MKLALISDVHIDGHPWSWDLMDGIPSDCNTVIMAGDISNDVWQASHWLAELKQRFANVAWVAGNHDFYNEGLHRTRLHDPDSTNIWPYPYSMASILDHYKRWSDAHGIHFLHRSKVEFEGVTFIGATGWHDYKAGDPYASEAQVGVWYKHMPDVCIRWKEHSWIPDHLDPYEAGVKDVVAIADMVKNTQGKIVVVTHHVPHRDLVWKKLHDPVWTQIHGSFVNTAMEQIRDPKIKAWFYGHTHLRGIKDIGHTTYVCNARGQRDQNPSWTPIVIEV